MAHQAAVGGRTCCYVADLLEQFAAAQKELGYRYCRFHALFDRDMDVVERAKDGSLTFKWHQIDKIYDALLAMGIRPFVELNPMPDALASGTQQLFWYKANVTPPQDFREWELLVHEFAKHLVRRYGLDEVQMVFRSVERTEPVGILSWYERRVFQTLQSECRRAQIGGRGPAHRRPRLEVLN